MSTGAGGSEPTSLRSAAADLMLGASCPLCGAPSRTLCGACLPRLAADPRTVRRRPVRVVAAGAHEDALQEVVVAWKEHVRLGLTPVLAPLLAAAVCTLDVGDDVVLVPVPSTRRSRRARGADVVAVLAAQTADVLRQVGVRARPVTGLRMVRQTRDQSGLGAQARRANLAGALGVHRPVRLAGARVVVVDDVVTTGATLGEAATVLRAAGVHVLGAATVSGRR